MQKRFLLFLFGCIGTRFFLVYLAMNISINLLKIMGYIALIPAFGFIYLFLTGQRKTGAEVFGDKIWWSNLRPIHAVFYLLFAYNAINGRRDAWHFLLYDVLFGLSSFLIYHYMSGDFSKII